MLPEVGGSDTSSDAAASSSTGEPAGSSGDDTESSGSTSSAVGSSSTTDFGATDSGSGSTDGTGTAGSEDTGTPAWIGDWEGTWTGICVAFPYPNLPWSMTVAEDGTVAGNLQAVLGNERLLGTVDVTGAIVGTFDTSLQSACDWTGTLDDSGGSGQWHCSASCEGTWSGALVP